MLFIAALSFAIAFACLLALISQPVRNLALDRPNERSLHAIPVPRTGGLAVLAGAAGSFAYISGAEQAPLLIGLALGVVSFGDDLYGLPTLLRLVAHLAAATAALLLIDRSFHPLLFVLLLLGIGWLTNLYNFMDGSDGLAAGMAVAGFGAFALAAHFAGAAPLAATSLCLASSSLAFLLFNFHPARIFMGDVGSIPLGFLAGALGVAGWSGGVWPIWFPVLVFSPFVVDATFTLGRRLLRREKVWQAHREHYYQRLVRMGFGHRKTALAEYALMLVCASAAIAVRGAPAELQAGVLATATVVFVALAACIDWRWNRFLSGKVR